MQTVLTVLEVGLTTTAVPLAASAVCSAITPSHCQHTHTYHKMRAFTVALLLVVVAACSAFAPVGSRTAVPTRMSKISLSMADDEVEDIATPEILPDASDEPKKNIVKNIPKGEVREVKWVDDAPTANVSFAMSWGYLFVVLPGALFLNDIFHIVPKGTFGIF